MKSKGLILLDRDGVLNRMVINPDHGTIDSPLHPNQVEVDPEIPEVLAVLNQMGYGLAIASNQPAAAKGKTTMANLEQVHQRVLELIQARGAQVLSSHLCFHRQEDRCSCRKPKPGLLDQAFKRHAGYDRAASWMVGDGITDIQAGQALGLKTAFLGPRKCDMCKAHETVGNQPTLWVASLADFAQKLKNL